VLGTKWTIQRPQLRLYCSWDGDNLAEVQTAFPDWTFQVNGDGSLHARDPHGMFNTDVEVGTWFTSDAMYSSDPTTTNEVQQAPSPGVSGLVSYDLTAD
jgi:hypothetical protein